MDDDTSNINSETKNINSKNSGTKLIIKSKRIYIYFVSKSL